MARYTIKPTRTASTTLAVGVWTASATPRRTKTYELNLGCSGAPNDNAFDWQIQRCTTAGTSSAVTPQPLDPADAAALFAAGENITVTPTLTAGQILLDIALNQRATYRWLAAPYSELVTPATQNNGLALTTPTAPALTVNTTVFIEEQ